jgi:hypothetical protein
MRYNSKDYSLQHYMDALPPEEGWVGARASQCMNYIHEELG